MFIPAVRYIFMTLGSRFPNFFTVQALIFRSLLRLSTHNNGAADCNALLKVAIFSSFVTQQFSSKHGFIYFGRENPMVSCPGMVLEMCSQSLPELSRSCCERSLVTSFAFQNACYSHDICCNKRNVRTSKGLEACGALITT